MLYTLMSLIPVEMFSFSQMFNGLSNSVKTIGGAFVTMLGFVMIVIAGWQIAKGLIGHGKTQTNWFITIALLVVGGVFAFGGIAFLVSLSKNAGSAVNNLANGGQINTILPFLFK